VFISGNAHILWNVEDRKGFDGAERIIVVEIEQSIYLPAFMAMTDE
jgi:hypothetical protein